MTVTAAFLSKLEARRADEFKQCEALLVRIQNQGREQLTDAEEIDYRAHRATLKALDEHIRDTKSEIARAGAYQLSGQTGGQDAMTYARHWSMRAAEKMTRAMGGGTENRAVVSGSIDIPALVETEIIPIARPIRLIDLFPNRVGITGNAFEYFQQTVRTNNAAPVPDAALKPTSIFTVKAVQDRARVIAHLSEETPVRIWDDHQELQSWLTTELMQGVLDELENQVISGDGTGENFTGLLETPGTTQVAFDTDPATTLRSAVTALQSLGEVPTGWALNPADAAEIDLARWGTAGGFLSEGYATGADTPGSNNVFGSGTQRVVSNSVPQGVGILGDWSKLRIFVRQDATLAIDASGPLFTHNTFVARAEGRFGLGVLRPSAFAIADLSGV